MCQGAPSQEAHAAQSEQTFRNHIRFLPMFHFFAFPVLFANVVLPPDLRARITELTRQQLIGLRFASDDELPDLVRRVLGGSLKRAGDIKKAVRSWQGDYLRA